MKIQKHELLAMHANLCRMMAHPARIAIAEAICDGERCVGEIAAAIDESMSTTSQHLRQLRDNGVVNARKDGQTVYYSLRHPKLMEACHLIREVLVEELTERGRAADRLAEQTPATGAAEDGDPGRREERRKRRTDR